MEMLGRCRERVPGVAVSSDFIVGFCGETEASFQKTVDLVRESRFKNSFIFKYSERPGTKAADRFADDVPEEVKKRRNNDLLAVQNGNSLADHRAQIGKVVEVLVEGPSKRGAASRDREGAAILQLTGRAMTDHIVVFDGPERLTGRTLRIHVDDASAFTLYGRVLTGEHIGDAADFTFTPDSGTGRTADAEDSPKYPVPLDFAAAPEIESKRIRLPLA
jgi:tRNA-2-methylthio-N6-dimethylallyladenosine synthase